MGARFWNNRGVLSRAPTDYWNAGSVAPAGRDQFFYSHRHVGGPKQTGRNSWQAPAHVVLSEGAKEHDVLRKFPGAAFDGIEASGPRGREVRVHSTALEAIASWTRMRITAEMVLCSSAAIFFIFSLRSE